MENNTRGSFTGNLGFVLAAAGAAVGLGNVWKFPYLAGSSGGGVFLLLYLCICCVVGFPLLVAETSIGRHGQADGFTSFRRIAAEANNKHPKLWGFFGFFGTLSGMVVYTYYTVVGGWVLAYVWKTATSPLDTLTGDEFTSFITSPFAPLVATVLFTAVCFAIIWGGVQRGIEKACKIIMPALIILLIAVFIRVITLPGSFDGIKYLFVPSIQNMNEAGGLGKVALAAMSQSFFTLSMATGIMIIYGSYQPKDSNLIKNSVSVILLDTLVALLAGVCVLGTVFAFGQEPSSGAGMLFGSLTLAFNSMGKVVGRVFASVFFFAVFLAAVSSAISLLEVSVSFLTDTCKIERKKAQIGYSTIAFVIAIIASLSNGLLADINIFGLNIFDALGWFGETLLMPLAGIFICLLVGWVWKPENALREITNQGALHFPVAGVWSFLVKYILPFGIVYIFVVGIF